MNCTLILSDKAETDHVREWAEKNGGICDLTFAVEPVEVAVLSRREAYSEKLRAALTRREPAIRDYHDLDHAVRTKWVATTDRKLIELRYLRQPGETAENRAIT